MPPKCAVQNCRTWKNFERSKLKFFSFPRNPEICRLWIRACGKGDFNTTNARVCSLHFVDDDYRLRDRLLNTPMKKRFLDSKAVPSRELPDNVTSLMNSGKDKRADERNSKKIVEDAIKDFDMSMSSSQNQEVKPKKRRSKKTTPLNVYNSDNNSTLLSNTHFEESTIPKEVVYTSTSIEIVDGQEVKLESDSLSSAEDIGTHEEHIYATSIDIAYEQPIRMENGSDGMESTMRVNTNLDTTCRLCIASIKQSDEEITSLFDDIDIPIQLQEFNISMDDGLPQHICKHCSTVLSEIKRFHQLVRQSQEILRIQFNKGSEIKIDYDAGPYYPDVGEFKMESELIIDNETISGIKQNNNPDTDDDNKLDEWVHSDAPVLLKKAKKGRKKIELHGNEIYYCDFCNASYRRKASLKRHMAAHSTVIKTCPHCNATYTNKFRYKFHLRSHDPIKKHKCQYCEKSFQHKHHLRNHETVHTGVRSFLCFICGMDFRTEQQHAIHSRTHLDVSEEIKPVKEYDCKKCDKKFSSYSGLYVHKGVHTKPVTCTICHQRFSQLSNLRSHMVRNHDDRERVPGFSCTICPKTFRLPSSLYNHMNKHTEKRDHVCNMCGSAFKRPYHLQSHIRIVHLKEKPFKCEICGQRFSLHGDIVDHMYYHSEEKSFACDICPLKYRTKRYLVQHIRSHTGEKPYQCGYCVQAFSTYAQISFHHKSKHKTDDIPANGEIMNFLFNLPQIQHS